MTRVTLKQIAERAGVAHTTVSRILSGKWEQNVKPETRSRVVKIAEEMGYRPHAGARLMVTGRSYTVAFAAPTLSAHAEKMLIAARQELERRGLRLSIHFGAMSQIIDELSEAHVDGAILLDYAEPDSSLVQRLMPNVPLVGVGNYHSSRFDYVEVDLSRATREAVRHLIKRGCRRIVHLTDQIDLIEGGDTRLRVYVEAMSEAGLCPEWRTVRAETLLGGLDAARNLLREPNPPDGIFCRNDVIGTAAIRAAHELGLRVPADVAIAGCDNIDVSEYLVPSLTTLAQPFDEAVRLAADFVTRRMQDPSLTQQTAVIQARFLPRESSWR
jgi:DNA-binding LacI/PurR family transcriptional regulator